MVSLTNFLDQYKKFILAAAILKWMALHSWILHEWFLIDLNLSIWDSAVSTLALIALSLVMYNILQHYIPGQGKFWYALGLSFALSWLCHWAVYESLYQVGANNQEYVNFLMKSAPVRWVIDFLVIGGVSVSSILYSQLIEQQEKSKREAITQNMVKEAELQKLQLQLQPHFLFNSLNSISALTMTNTSEARKMIQHLSDFLRSTIKRADEHWITLKEEFNHLQLYLEIERVRFGHRLKLETVLSEETLSCTIPTLILQPLVENAIKFGLYGTTGTVVIKMVSEKINKIIKITITNPFDPEGRPEKGSGFGLSGIERRLYLLFARNDLLETTLIDNEFQVILKIPVYHDQNHPH